MSEDIRYREHKSVAITILMGSRFHIIDGEVHFGVTNVDAGYYFEDLSAEQQAEVISQTAFDPEKLNMASLGKIIGGVRACLNWLEANPDKTMADLESVVQSADL